MEPGRFDALARRLSMARGRRDVVATLIAAAVAPAFGARAGAAPEAAGGECRYPGMRCAASKNCCAGSGCVDGRCRCTPGLIQCGDFCLTREEATARDCCKPYKSRCRRSDPIPCCGASTCSGRLDGKRVCCGLEIHPCTTRTQAFCCSGRCGAHGRCTPPFSRRPTPARGRPPFPGRSARGMARSGRHAAPTSTR